jgi:hypothetical protein
MDSPDSLGLLLNMSQLQVDRYQPLGPRRREIRLILILNVQELVDPPRIRTVSLPINDDEAYSV